MAFNYNHLEDVDTSQNSEILKKFNDILEKNNLSGNFKNKLETVNLHYKENQDKIPQDEVVNKIRWNTYYYKKYRQQTRLLFFIIFICVLMIVLSKLRSRSPYFDEKAYSFVIGIILGVTFIYMIYGLWDLLLKDDKNFDEYDYSIYGISGKDITELNEVESISDKPKCKPKTNNSVNTSFLNKYF
jgi:lipopolysaccharide export LptBFGC system permease protein LptF